MRTLALALLSILLPLAVSAQEPGVRRVANGKYVIDAAYLDRAMKDLTPVLQQARAVPHFEKGAMVGFKLTQIAPDSIYHRLGLKNGDVVLSINGSTLESPGKAIQVFGSLKGVRHLNVRLKRKSKQVTHVYDVRK
jgi:general secretion pathway protein C